MIFTKLGTKLFRKSAVSYPPVQQVALQSMTGNPINIRGAPTKTTILFATLVPIIYCGLPQVLIYYKRITSVSIYWSHHGSLLIPL